MRKSQDATRIAISRAIDHKPSATRLLTSPEPGQVRKQWTVKEESRLKQLVEQYSPVLPATWQEISWHFEGRSAASVRRKWTLMVETDGLATVSTGYVGGIEGEPSDPVMNVPMGGQLHLDHGASSEQPESGSLISQRQPLSGKLHSPFSSVEYADYNQTPQVPMLPSEVESTEKEPCPDQDVNKEPDVFMSQSDIDLLLDESPDIAFVGDGAPVVSRPRSLI